VLTNLEAFKCMLDVIDAFKREKVREIVVFYQPAEIIFKEYDYLNYA
jgi:hypothetical protein